MLNVSLGAALEDNMFNDEERATLLPQVQQMIKTLGGELKIGDSVENTSVVWGRNQGYAQTYTIKDFLHTVLKDKDVITPAFGAHLQQLAKQMKNNKLGGGNGEEKNSPELSAEEYKKYTNIYGTEFTKLPRDVAARVKEAEDLVKNKALKDGIIVIDKDKKINFVGTKEDLERIADYEEEIYDNLGLDTIASKGFFTTNYKKITDEKDAKKYEKAERRTNKIANESISDAKEMSKKGTLLSAMGAQAFSKQAEAAAVSSLFSRWRKNANKKDAEKEQKKLNRRGE